MNDSYEKVLNDGTEELKRLTEKLDEAYAGVQNDQAYLECLSKSIIEKRAEFDALMSKPDDNSGLRELKISELSNLTEYVSEQARQINSRYKAYLLMRLEKSEFQELMSQRIRHMQTEINNSNNAILQYQDNEIKSKDAVIEKRSKAPKVHKQKTDSFWDGYRQKFDSHIANGKKEAWALNEIGKLIEREGTWKKTAKNNPQVTITRPDRSTLRRQLVTKHK